MISKLMILMLNRTQNRLLFNPSYAVVPDYPELPARITSRFRSSHAERTWFQYNREIRNRAYIKTSDAMCQLKL